MSSLENTLANIFKSQLISVRKESGNFLENNEYDLEKNKIQNVTDSVEEFHSFNSLQIQAKSVGPKYFTFDTHSLGTIILEEGDLLMYEGREYAIKTVVNKEDDDNTTTVYPTSGINISDETNTIVNIIDKQVLSPETQGLLYWLLTEIVRIVGHILSSQKETNDDEIIEFASKTQEKRPPLFAHIYRADDQTVQDFLHFATTTHVKLALEIIFTVRVIRDCFKHIQGLLPNKKTLIQPLFHCPQAYNLDLEETEKTITDSETTSFSFDSGVSVAIGDRIVYAKKTYIINSITKTKDENGDLQVLHHHAHDDDKPSLNADNKTVQISNTVYMMNCILLSLKCTLDTVDAAGRPVYSNKDAFLEIKSQKLTKGLLRCVKRTTHCANYHATVNVYGEWPNGWVPSGCSIVPPPKEEMEDIINIRSDHADEQQQFGVYIRIRTGTANALGDDEIIEEEQGQLTVDHENQEGITKNKKVSFSLIDNMLNTDPNRCQQLLESLLYIIPIEYTIVIRQQPFSIDFNNDDDVFFNLGPPGPATTFSDVIDDDVVEDPFNILRGGHGDDVPDDLFDNDELNLGDIIGEHPQVQGLEENNQQAEDPEEINQQVEDPNGEESNSDGLDLLNWNWDTQFLNHGFELIKEKSFDDNDGFDITSEKVWKKNGLQDLYA